MTKKSEKEVPKFELKKRVPKDKPNLFANVTPIRHPISEILNFPSAEHSSENTTENSAHEVSPETNSPSAAISSENIISSNSLDIQTKSVGISKDEYFGYPNNKESDIQVDNVGYPNSKDLDIPTTKKRISKGKEIGYPKDANLDILISKNTDWISKENKDLDIKISKSENLDIQKTSKTGKWEKYDAKRKAKGVFLRTNEDITKKFKQFCIGQAWDFSYGTELAWKNLMENLDIQTSGDLDILIAHDDRRLRLLFKTKHTIINIYLRYNSIFNDKTKWTVKDDDAASKFNDLDIGLIELGIIQTQGNKNFTGKINSFSYYVNEIQNFAELNLPPESIAMMLDINRKRWQQATKRELDLSFLESPDKTN